MTMEKPACKVPNGRCTIESTRTGEHRTFRIWTQAADAEFAPGKRVVALLTGSQNDDPDDYTGFAFIDEQGRLPVFSVDTEEEAENLIVATCPMGYDGKYYARELAQEQTLENLYAFSEKIATVHDRMVERGTCTCR